MAKYRALIEQLELLSPTRRDARKLLVAADGRALSSLSHALTEHPDAAVREEVAEILGERKHWNAIPSLIDALADNALFVRQDALRSIEMICLMQPAGLSMLLDLSSELNDAKSQVLEWWTANGRFIEGNANLC
ncbi:MAG: HEAT repeat domain-containing protein [Planctomycetes bacterium]|nr:HEAT repeat domain-containing protein [Planctomycetota bacterium]